MVRSSERPPSGALRHVRSTAGPVAVLLAVAAAGAAAAAPEAPPHDTRSWYASGAAALERAKAQPRPGTRARNLVLFLGDGMGVSTVTAGRILAGQQAGGSGEEHALAFETLPVAGLVKTYNTNQQVPDSAGTMTAIVTGVKTRAGVISIGPEAPRGDCAASRAQPLTSLLELAEAAGHVTGIVSTARITHATPAATYAKSADRNWEVDGDLPEDAREQSCRDIAAQLIEFAVGDGIEVVLGGGRSNFLPDSLTDPEYPFLNGKRRDGRDLTAEWQRRRNGVFLWNREAFTALDPADAAPVLGLFEPSHMQFEVDRTGDAGGEPSLAEMTAFAIDRLVAQRGDHGFVLVVEAGRIDHGHHAANAYRALHDTVALSDAVAVALAKTDAADTLILVTADHSHTMTISGYPQRGNPILGKVHTTDARGEPAAVLARDAAGLPYTTIAYANGPGHVGQSATQPAGSKRLPHFTDAYTRDPVARPDLTEVDTAASTYLQESAVPLGSESHGGEDVPLYASGPGSQWLGGVLEQHVLFHVMRDALALPDALDSAAEDAPNGVTRARPDPANRP
jgi:alkaline phosphatase